MALVLVGKLLIALGICFQAYTLFENKTTAASFDTRVSTLLATCNCIPAEIQEHIKAHLRLVVVAFLGFSGLMVLFKSSLLKVPVLLGLLILFLVRHYPLTAVPSFKDHSFWELVATIGGIIYLMGAEGGCCAHKKQVAPATEKKSEPEKPSKGKAKRN